MTGIHDTIEVQLAHLCDLAWRGRIDPAVIEWLHRREAPRAHSYRARADWLLAQFVALYSPTPGDDEIIAAGQVLAGAPGDADDIAVAFASCAMFMGMECALVAEDHGHGFTHVTVAVKDIGVGREGSCSDVSETWLRYDPTYGHGPGEGPTPIATMRRECKP